MSLSFIRILFYFILFLTFNSLARNYNILDVDFIESMVDRDEISLKKLTQNPKYNQYLKILAENYEANKPSKMLYMKESIIPKIMHHVWLGGDIPPLYQNYLNECRKIHPNWEFKIWNEDAISNLNLEYQDLYDKSRSYPAKSDIARYEILYRYGGVYRDMDVKCYRPLDDLNHMYQLYVPLEYYTENFDRPTINNGIIGASAKNYIKKTLEAIKENYDNIWNDFDLYNNSSLGQYSNTGMAAITTMLPLTDVFIQNSNSDKTIAFPTSYFIPLVAYNYDSHLTIFNTTYFQSVKPETMMWHNFAKKEIIMLNFASGNGLNDPTRKRIFNKLPYFARHQYEVLEKVYASNNTSKSSWSKKSKTPQVINFIIFNQKESLELEKHLANWRMFNGDFEIKIWDNQNISQTFSDIKNFNNDEVIEEFRFYLALRILAKFGGSYADFKVKPLNSIFELNNKYNFYAALEPINKKSKILRFSQKLIGSNANHNIIIKTLARVNINNLDSIKNINKFLVEEAYKWIYLDGKNIVLPAVYFEPIDYLENDFWYIPYDYIVTIFNRKSLSYVSKYSVIQ